MTGESKFWAFFGYVPLVGFIVVMLLKKQDRFAMFHAKQGIVWLVALFIVSIAARILGIIPFLGIVIAAALWIILLVLLIMGIINALSGKEKLLPLIGSFASKIKI